MFEFEFIVCILSLNANVEEKHFQFNKKVYNNVKETYIFDDE